MFGLSDCIATLDTDIEGIGFLLHQRLVLYAWKLMLHVAAVLSPKKTRLVLVFPEPDVLFRAGIADENRKSVVSVYNRNHYPITQSRDVQRVLPYDTLTSTAINMMMLSSSSAFYG